MAKKPSRSAAPAAKPPPAVTPHHVELATQAGKDLAKLDKPAREQLADVLRSDLSANPQPANLDVKALKGASPWLRLRVGDHRIIYRPLTPDELTPLVARLPTKARPSGGYLVARIVNRRDLEKAVSTL